MDWSGKEREAVEVMKEAGWSIMNHDDKICYRAQKTGTGGSVGIGLTGNFWQKVEPVMRDGVPIVTGYWNKEKDERHKESWADTLEGQERLRSETGWKPTTRKEYTKGFPKGVSVTFEANQVDIRLVNLYDDLESRYRSTLDYVASMAGEIIKYVSKLENPTDRNIREAMRNRLKRAFKPVEYEHNIIFMGQIGRDLMRDFRAIAEQNKKMHLEENTVYLDGWKKTAKQKRRIKYYDIGARDSARGGKAGEIFKLEVTLLKEYFVDAGLAVEDLKEQPEIQEKIYQELCKNLSVVLDLLKTGGESMNGLQYELGLSGMQNNYQVAGALLSSRRTLTGRVQALEVKQAETDKRLAKLEAKGQSGK